MWKSFFKIVAGLVLLAVIAVLTFPVAFILSYGAVFVFESVSPGSGLAGLLLFPIFWFATWYASAYALARFFKRKEGGGGRGFPIVPR